MSAASPRPSRRLRFPGVRPPRPLLGPEAEGRLTGRQRELLAELEKLLGLERLADLPMARIAARLGCSLRTCYGIAPSKEELILAVVDRRLHRIGRKAVEQLDASLPPLDAVRVYLRTVNEAVQPETASVSRDFAELPGAQRLVDAHEEYVIAVTRSLLERAVSTGAIPPVDTASVAHVLGGLGREFARPEVAAAAAASPRDTANALTEILLRGLARQGSASYPAG